MTALAILRGVVGVMPPWMTVRATTALLVLADQGASGAMRFKLLALGISIPPPSLSRLCDTLAGHGLVERVRHTSRNVDIALTPAGRDMARRIADMIELNGVVS